MKKTFLLIAALFIMGSTFAGGGLFYLGPKIGYQTAKLSYDQADIKASFANHFTVGVFGRFTIARVYIQPEVLYFKTSNIFNVDVTGTGTDNLFNLPTGANVNLTLNQMNLQVPVLIGFNIIDSKLITFRAQVGPTANFLLKSQTVFDKSYTINGVSNEMDEQQQNAANNQKFDTKSISWGLQAGLGLDFFKHLTLDINYNFGLSKVFKNLNNTTLGEYFDFDNADNVHQHMFMVTVGYSFL